MSDSPETEHVQPNAGRPTDQAAASAPTVAHGVAQSRGLFDREILRQALVDSLKKFDPRDPGEEPGHVRGPRGQLRHPHRGHRTPGNLHLVDHDLAVPHRRCSPTSPKPWRKGAARLRPTRCARCARRPKRAACCPTAQKSGSPHRSSARATWSSARPGMPSRLTARSSKASLRWTSRR